MSVLRVFGVVSSRLGVGTTRRLRRAVSFAVCVSLLTGSVLVQVAGAEPQPPTPPVVTDDGDGSDGPADPHTPPPFHPPAKQSDVPLLEDLITEGSVGNVPVVVSGSYELRVPTGDAGSDDTGARVAEGVPLVVSGSSGDLLEADAGLPVRSSTEVVVTVVGSDEAAQAGLGVFGFTVSDQSPEAAKTSAADGVSVVMSRLTTTRSVSRMGRIGRTGCSW